MRPKATTVEPNDHVAAAAYLMKHAGVTALVIVDAMTGQPAGIITETDITHAVADGKNLDDVRIHDLMTTRPVVIDPAISISDAARAMTGGRFRHLPVIGDDLYAWSAPELVQRRHTLPSKRIQCWGVVEGWGRVIEHEKGFRALHMRPLAQAKPSRGEPMGVLP